jgi:hypothetical protein
MEFLSVKEFNSSPRKTHEILQKNGKIVLTNNGKPTMLVFDIIGKDLEQVIDTLNRAEGMRLLESIQLQSVRGGLNTMSLDDINDEIASYRKDRAYPSISPTYR